MFHLSQVFSGHEDSITCGGFSSSGKAALTGSMDGTFRIWSPRKGTCKHLIEGHAYHEEAVVCLDVHNNKPIVLTGAMNGTVRLSNIKTGKVLQSFDHQDRNRSIESVEFSKTNNWFASGGMDCFIDIWDLTTGNIRVSMKTERGVIKVRLL